MTIETIRMAWRWHSGSGSETATSKVPCRSIGGASARSARRTLPPIRRTTLTRVHTQNRSGDWGSPPFLSVFMLRTDNRMDRNGGESQSPLPNLIVHI
eukprot:SAG25_NODE_514_length_7279_cov_5.792758_4_plen_98_part_00